MIKPLKMIIVDDEHLILESLETLMDWQSIGIQVVGTADNGATAIDLTFKANPDIILSDISMPSFTGLEMLEVLRKKQMTVEVIFITAYSSFDYANEAIKHGAYGYILKPINEELLLETVSRCATKIRESKLLSLSGLAERNWIRHLNSGNSLYYESIVGTPSRKYHTDEEVKAALIKKIKNNELEVIHDILLDLFRVINKEEGGLEPNNLRLHCFELLDSLLREFQDYRLDSYLRKDDKELNLKKYIAGCGDLDATFEVTINLIKNYGNAINEMQRQSSKRLVSEAVDYIHNNYNKDITLSQVAGHLFITPPYLSKLFSTQMNETFSKYLLSYRIKIAKELLGDTHLKIYEIAKKVGYTDVVHFSKVFKQFTGETPGQYRNRN